MYLYNTIIWQRNSSSPWALHREKCWSLVLLAFLDLSSFVDTVWELKFYCLLHASLMKTCFLSIGYPCLSPSSDREPWKLIFVSPSIYINAWGIIIVSKVCWIWTLFVVYKKSAVACGMQTSHVWRSVLLSSCSLMALGM